MGDQRLSGGSHRNGLATAGISRVLVRLHDAGCDQKVRFHDSPVQMNRHAARCHTQIHQR